MAADTAVLALRVDNRRYIKGVDKAARSTNALSTSGLNVKKVMGALGLAYAGREMLRFSKSAFMAAVAAEEITNKYKTVFETLPRGARKVSKAFAKDFGLAQSTAEELLSGTGDLLVGFGFSEEAALDLSKRVNELSVDLASFQNLQGGASRASEALTKALLGETESAKSLGIVIRQNTKEYRDQVAEIAKAQGISVVQAKAIANLEIAYKQSTKAVGDFARTQNSTANQLRQTGEAWKDFTIAVGEAGIAISKVAGPDGKGVISFLNNMSDGVRNNILVFQEFAILAKTSIKSIGTAIGFLTSTFTSFGENVIKIGTWVWENWSKIWANIADTVQFAMAGALSFFENAWTSAVAFMKNPSQDAAQALIDSLKPTELGQKVLDGISEGLDLDKLELTKTKRFKDLFDELEKLNANAAAQIEKLYDDAFKKVVASSKKSKALVAAEGAKTGMEAANAAASAAYGAYGNVPAGPSSNLASAMAKGSAEAFKTLRGGQGKEPEEKTAKNTESIDKTLKRSLSAGNALVTVNLGGK